MRPPSGFTSTFATGIAFVFRIRMFFFFATVISYLSKFFDGPHMVADPCGHRRSDPQRSVNPAKVVMCEM